MLDIALKLLILFYLNPLLHISTLVVCGYLIEPTIDIRVR